MVPGIQKQHLALAWQWERPQEAEARPGLGGHDLGQAVCRPWSSGTNPGATSWWPEVSTMLPTSIRAPFVAGDETSGPRPEQS